MENRANKIQITNLKMPSANTEYRFAIPKGCQWFTLQVRDGATLRIATDTGHVADSHPPYFTLKQNMSWDERYLQVDIQQGLTLFFASPGANKTIEVLMGVYDPELEGAG